MSAKLLKAVEFVITAHAGQIRKWADEPYVLHPIRVAKMVQSAWESEDIVIAALLHDVLEDCLQVTSLQIHDQFGPYILSIVVGLTDEPATPSRNRGVRKAADTDRLIHANAQVQTIKCADCIDNIPSICENDKNFAPMFIREKQALIPHLVRGEAGLYTQANLLLAEWARKIEVENYENALR